MDDRILGIHHVTAIVGEPQENVDFYTIVLGLRLIKRTVNFDDPYTYHLYYGDELGRPGTIVTFFPWPGAQRGSNGTGQVSAMAFSVPDGGLDYWAARLTENDCRYGGPEERFGRQVLSFYDPSGLLLELIAQPGVEAQPYWSGGTVPHEYAIRGLSGVTMTVGQLEPTAALLTDVLDFRHVATASNRARYEVGDGGPGAQVDVVSRPDVPFGNIAVGSVHHVAWRVAGDEQELVWREKIIRSGFEVTEVRDRNYFHSIYFREPGGVLFEIATDTPGFATDEAPETLGRALKLPQWLEPMRGQIEQRLPMIGNRE
jgi:glyoxalase family protein